jgi:signal transduction histidine kinase
VLLEDGRTLGRSRATPAEAADLPRLGEELAPLEELVIGDAEYNAVPVRAAQLRTVRQRKPSRSAQPPRAPEQMAFDIRVVLDRTAADEQLARLTLCLAGGFPVFLGLSAVGGVYLIRRAVRPVELAIDRERRFSGTASHELRTPLTALRGEIDVALRRERTPAEYVAALRRMDALVGRMTSLVEGLLVLARARAGQLLQGAAAVRVAALRAAMEEVIRLLPGHERVTLVCTAPEAIRIVSDPFLLALAVRNLVENALVHAPEGPVQVQVSADTAGGLHVLVEDQGPGLPAEVLATYNGSPAGSEASPRRGGGVGLGLSIAQAVIESHGGTLSLQNQPESGCRAAITLPGRPGAGERPGANVPGEGSSPPRAPG